MKAIFFIKGFIKNIPGIEYVKNFHKNNGGSTLNARYCYSVWLRHLILAHENGLHTIPKVIAELGPGDSLGVGISALLSGADKYFAFDVIKYQPTEINLKIFDELVALFINKTDIPNEDEFPEVRPLLKNYKFPSDIFSQSYLDEILQESRLVKIRNSIAELNNKCQDKNKNVITYIVPWDNNSLMINNSVDMIISQAVLQHVNHLGSTYEAMGKWLKPQGIMSHQIDFTSMGSSENLQGHWTYSELKWKLIKGRVKYYINREPYSKHIELLKHNNFKIILEIKKNYKSSIDKKKLARRFKNLTPEDLKITDLFIQSIKLK